jgi:ATP-dependent DNA helicase RecQ
MIIQWRVTCDMCTLWQRFGRAARLVSLCAVAILIAESKYFDAKPGKKEPKKRKADTTLKSEKPTKKNRQSQPSSPKISAAPPTTSAETATTTAASTVPETYTDEQLRLLYIERRQEEPKGRVTGKEKTLEAVMDHFINAKTRTYLLCFRKPPQIYFGNLKISE